MPPARRYPRPLFLCVFAAWALLAVLPHDVMAQDAKDAPAPKPGKVASNAPAAPDVIAPSAEKTLILTRSTLLSLNDALQTGNYTVLRDLAAPSFRDANTAGRLHQIFSGLSTKGIDLSAAAIVTPKFRQPPVMDQSKRLHISGHFPGRPVQIDFEMFFEAVAGRWRLFGISVNPARSPSAASSAPATDLPGAGKPPPQSGKARQQK